MHRKKPRKSPPIPLGPHQNACFFDRLPPLPASGIGRALRIVIAYILATLVISLLAVSSVLGIAWILLQGVQLFSLPGLVIDAIGVALVVWSSMYLTNGLERWRMRNRYR